MQRRQPIPLEVRWRQLYQITQKRFQRILVAAFVEGGVHIVRRLEAGGHSRQRRFIEDSPDDGAGLTPERLQRDRRADGVGDDDHTTTECLGHGKHVVGLDLEAVRHVIGPSATTPAAAVHRRHAQAFAKMLAHERPGPRSHPLRGWTSKSGRPSPASSQPISMPSGAFTVVFTAATLAHVCGNQGSD